MKKRLYNSILSGLFLALALLLPFVTASDPKIGNMFLPMHIPIMLCGYICGPIWGLAAGIIAPLLRNLLFSAPQLFPTAIAMCAELGCYGLVCGLLYKILPKSPTNTYISLIISMLLGRLVWGGISLLLYSFSGKSFGFELFISGAILSAIPGIILQIAIIPPLIIIANKHLKK